MNRIEKLKKAIDGEVENFVENRNGKHPNDVTDEIASYLTPNTKGCFQLAILCPEIANFDLAYKWENMGPNTSDMLYKEVYKDLSPAQIVEASVYYWIEARLFDLMLDAITE